MCIAAVVFSFWCSTTIKHKNNESRDKPPSRRHLRVVGFILFIRKSHCQCIFVREKAKKQNNNDKLVVVAKDVKTRYGKQLLLLLTTFIIIRCNADRKLDFFCFVLKCFLWADAPFFLSRFYCIRTHTHTRTHKLPKLVSLFLLKTLFFLFR